MPHSQTIRCINKGYGRSPHERILNVGGVNEDGSHWKQSQQQTIKEIEEGSWEYYSQLVWRRDRIVVATYLGYKYIKAAGDDIQPNTLLSLPECP
ncbi:DUF3892 domain-containing protein [Methylocapsa sp. S129]|uniref:DUF3892 domain-containing protein n=1 Tax=Methylocapsa sp. S129 TaxID=1641869 RepID=UPI00131CCFBE|nr:DUF3892 domain-containing protein [Methylocapsa sp. S129]